MKRIAYAVLACLVLICASLRAMEGADWRIAVDLLTVLVLASLAAEAPPRRSPYAGLRLDRRPR